MLTVIAGGPKTGKTTLAATMSTNVLHTDDLIALGWVGARDQIARWLGHGGNAVIEGVQACRGLRQWLREHPEGRPCDEVIWLECPKVACTKGQAVMARGIETVLREIEPELIRRGVRIRRAP